MIPLSVSVEVHTSVQLEKHVLGRAVGSDDEGKVAAAGNPGYFPIVAEIGKVCIGNSVRVEAGVSVRAIGAPDRDSTGRISILENGQGMSAYPFPEVGRFRAPQGEKEVAAGRNHHLVQLARVFVETAPVGGVVV